METDQPAERRTNRLKLGLAIGAAALAIAIAATAVYLYSEIERVHGPELEVFLTIPHGDDSRQIAATLARHGVISREWHFLVVRAMRPRDILQAGEYRFAKAASVREVFDRLVRGDVHYYSFTVPEGTNRFDTAVIIAELDWIEAADVLPLTARADLIKDLAPDTETLEGFLFPSTYNVTRGASAETIVEMMTAEFRQVWNGFDTDADVMQIVTLASLVEKETGAPSERAQVASVFHNRLRRGIKMECDPTVIYAAILEDRYDGIIHRSDLDNKHPYNTYQHPGLPPGPIASPGRQALRATLHPADTDYLFFVAAPDASGRHVFSETLSAHNRAVARYRSGERNRKSQARRLSPPASAGTNN
jgi:peptidoglycan lytic transglycosylase G